MLKRSSWRILDKRLLLATKLQGASQERASQAAIMRGQVEAFLVSIRSA